MRAARFLSDEALQDELGIRVEEALGAVAGTTEVAREGDGEWWAGWWSVAGTPEGPELIAAAAGVVDALATQLRSQVSAFPRRWDDPDLPSGAKRFRDVLLSLSEFEPTGPAERTRALRDALLAFGSETEDNVAAAAVLAVRFGPIGRLVLALEGGPELSALANELEGGEVPPQLRHAFPALTQAQWAGFARMVTLILCALEEP